ncbi:MAG: Ig-like domain-containing protein, partial [Muribaculaceae bacterium]|nr:Ig-like domain-containing protein [Muribaculaceae bacterium]
LVGSEMCIRHRTEGESATLTATVEPADATDPTVCWTTSDSAVATVADGLITAVAAGECTVTASCGKATATCTVTVKAKEDDSSINEISATSTPDAYDLQGRRVANPANGLYIIGGKLIRK